MGYAMAERLAKNGCDIAVWNRTKAKADPLAKHGAKVVNQLEELSTKDILFVMVSTYEDVKEVVGKALAKGKPKMVVRAWSTWLHPSAGMQKSSRPGSSRSSSRDRRRRTRRRGRTST